MNPKSKGYGNLGWGSPKDKAHESRGCPRKGNGPTMPKRMRWAKKAQNSMNASPMVILGHENLANGKYTAGPKEAQQA